MSPAFNTMVAAMDAAVINNLGSVSFIFAPQDNSTPQTLRGMICPPAMEEDYAPGSLTGTAVVRLFVQFAAISPQPQKGDAVTVNGIAYMIANVKAEEIDGAVLKLRAT